MDSQHNTKPNRHSAVSVRTVQIGVATETSGAGSIEPLRSYPEQGRDFTGYVEQLCSREDFLRNGTAIKRFLDELKAGRIRMEGTLKVTGEMKSIEPNIASKLAKQLLREMGYNIVANEQSSYRDVVLLVNDDVELPTRGQDPAPKRNPRNAGAKRSPVWDEADGDARIRLDLGRFDRSKPLPRGTQSRLIRMALEWEEIKEAKENGMSWKWARDRVIPLILEWEKQRTAKN